MTLDRQGRERAADERGFDSLWAAEEGQDTSHDRDVATAAAHVAIDEQAYRKESSDTAADEHPDGKGMAEPAADETMSAAPDVPVLATPAGGETLVLGGNGHVWLRGDTPWKVAEHYYGDGRHWRKITSANAAKFSRGMREGLVVDIPPMELDTLTALLRFKDQPKALQALISLMPANDYEGFFKSLTPALIDRHGEFLQVLELMRATGKTVAELAEEQREFLKEKAAAEGKDIGESVGGVVKAKGYGGDQATFWNAQTGAERASWKRRFNEAVKAITSTAPADVEEIITKAESKGGGFRWSPAEVEKSHAFAYTYGDSWELHCGVEWVKAAESDPSSVHGNIAHEMGGHNYYGQELGYAIQKGAMTRKEEASAEKSGNSIYSAYGYMETEIFAELYEFPYNFPSTEDRKYPSDTAFDTDKEGRDLTRGNFDNRGDVVRLLKRVKEQFAPGVAQGLVASLARRVQLDPRIVPMAKERFNEAVRNVFIAPP